MCPSEMTSFFELLFHGFPLLSSTSAVVCYSLARKVNFRVRFANYRQCPISQISLQHFAPYECAAVSAKQSRNASLFREVDADVHGMEYTTNI